MNPIILRGIRERLRIKHLIAAGLFSLIVSATIYFTAYLNEANGGWSYNPQTGQMEQNDPSPVKGARHAFLFFCPARFYLMFLEPAGLPPSPPRRRSPDSWITNA